VCWFKPSTGPVQGLQAVFNRLSPGTLRIVDNAVYFICTGRYPVIFLFIESLLNSRNKVSFV
jgi:hypothetical protein